MSEFTLITGGARSGKSSFAENLAKKYGDNVLYIATSLPLDDEMKLRIRKHREQRPACWETLEAYRDFDVILKGRELTASAILLDCITIMVTNLMFDANKDWDNIKNEQIIDVEKAVDTEISKLINAAKTMQLPFIMVTNETGMGIVPDNAISRVFRDTAGRVNQKLAKAADHVYLCVSGIPLKIK